MIDTKLIDVLPEKISVEAAYHLVNFLSNLAIEIENHYFTKVRSYVHDHNDE
jgi:hypothetical protein